LKKALLWEPSSNNAVACKLCHHKCTISSGKRGRCQVRKNVDGVLYTINYGNVIASNIDPIEKKPLFHFYPGSNAFSVAAVGCNFTCLFCQNCTISQADKFESFPMSGYVSPEMVVEKALQSGCKSIAHTYTEPTVYFEYVYDVSVLAREAGLKTVLVSNGFMSEEAVDMLLPYIDGINIDLKCWSEDTYKTFMGGRLEPVVNNIRRFAGSSVLVEVTTLVVPEMNSSLDELRSIADFLASVDKDIPWHVSRFHPAYKMKDRPATSIDKIKEAYDIGIKSGLHYVYTGNVLNDLCESTVCYNCQTMLVKRLGYNVSENHLKIESDDKNIGLDKGCLNKTRIVCPECGITHNFVM